jgi:hypothetical protein
MNFSLGKRLGKQKEKWKFRLLDEKIREVITVLNFISIFSLLNAISNN